MNLLVVVKAWKKIRNPDIDEESKSPEYPIVLPHRGPIGADFWKYAVCGLNPGQLN
jgi:hypothetical protein